MAAVGGGFLAMDAGVAQPSSFATFLGLVWLAVVVTLGIRSITAAVLAGLSFSLLPGVFQTYVPTRWGEVPTVLFGLGALGVALHPEGVVLQNGRQLRRLLARVLTPRSQPGGRRPRRSWRGVAGRRRPGRRPPPQSARRCPTAPTEPES